jgi:Anti-sigma-D factor RsdA to sigma factor binding region
MPDFGRWTSNGGDPSLNEINRTDRFLDSLAIEQPVYATDPGEAELAHLLAGWRDEVRDAPLTTAITPRDAVIAFDSARAARKRGRTLAIVGSAAAAVLCLGGFVSVVAGAGPGDSLYGLHTMFFGDKQNTRGDAVMLASQQLAEVKQLIDEGQWDAAQQKLQTLTTTVATVNDVEQKQDLVSQWQQLTVKVEQKDPEAVPAPGAPLPQMPDVPVVVAPESDTETSTSTSSETSTLPSSETSTTSTSPSSETQTTTTTSSPTTTTSSSESTTTTSSPTTTTSSPVQQLPATVTTTTTSVTVAPQPRVQFQAPPPSNIPATTPQAPSAALPPTHIVVQTPSPAVVEPAPAHEPEAAESPAEQAPKSAPSTTILMPEPGAKPN